MSLLAWIVLGLLAGVVASRFEGHHGSWSLSMGHAGIVGALIGGLLFERLGHAGVNGFAPYHTLLAGVGPIVVAAAYHLLFARSTSA